MVLLKISWDCDNFHTLSSVITIEGSNYFFSFLENYYSLLHFLPFAVPWLYEPHFHLKCIKFQICNMELLWYGPFPERPAVPEGALIVSIE